MMPLEKAAFYIKLRLPARTVRFEGAGMLRKKEDLYEIADGVFFS